MARLNYNTGAVRIHTRGPLGEVHVDEHTPVFLDAPGLEVGADPPFFIPWSEVTHIQQIAGDSTDTGAEAAAPEEPAAPEPADEPAEVSDAEGREGERSGSGSVRSRSRGSGSRAHPGGSARGRSSAAG